MAMASDDRTPEDERRRREAYETSLNSYRRRANDPAFMAALATRLTEMDETPQPEPVSREEFLTATERT